MSGLSAVYPGYPRADGAVYIADADNWRIRKVDSEGDISTLAEFDADEYPRPDRVLATGEGSLLVTTEYPRQLVWVSMSDRTQSPVPIHTEFAGEDTPSITLVAMQPGGRLIFFGHGQLLVTRQGESLPAIDRYLLVDPQDPQRPVEDIVAGAIGADGNLLLCDERNRRIVRVELPNPEEGGDEE